MKKFIFILGFVFLGSTLAEAQAPWRGNKLRAKKEAQKVEEALAAIPIHREKLTGAYQMLGPVYGQDALTNKKDAIIYQMRYKAYLAHADAIMEFRCKSFKGVYQSCEGIAIKFQGTSKN